jgi:hypothetical protein
MGNLQNQKIATDQHQARKVEVLKIKTLNLLLKLKTYMPSLCNIWLGEGPVAAPDVVLIA